jgi:hypothetical protein
MLSTLSGHNTAQFVPHKLPPPMPDDLLVPIAQLSRLNSNFPRQVNWQLRPVMQYASVSSPNAAFSNMFIEGIPYAVDIYRQFRSSVYAVFCKMEQGFPIPVGQLRTTIAAALEKTNHLEII